MDPGNTGLAMVLGCRIKDSEPGPKNRHLEDASAPSVLIQTEGEDANLGEV